MLLTWLIIDVVVIFALIAWLYRYRALHHLDYHREFTRSAVFEGETVEMVERIVNRKLLPLPWLRLESLLGRGLLFGGQANLDIRSGELFQNHISMFSLRPYRQIVRKHQVLCAKRGWYKLDSATMTTGDPLGIAQINKRFPLSLELLVYPAVQPLQELPLPNHSWLGEITVRRWIVEDPFLTAGIREYRAGDPLSSIHWKATARTGELQVHSKDYTADHRLLLCLNLETHEKMWAAVTDPERIEQGLRYAATVAEHAIRHGIETGFVCNGWVQGGDKVPIRLTPQGGSSQLLDILQTMARMELEAVVKMSWLLEREMEAGTADMDILILSCHQGEELRDTAELLQRRGNGVEWMHIPELNKRKGEIA
ncbi:DUF58 domain-containing protein [Paenibacillus silviterrae]|uniref:DUF58 domain-containing protein n=1 Tax=Paenibacillus silviterrae TaxID=3242194 RepID=UPI0025434391|nr:DUF58 domain-containing protein [Paenibacillus chinjuensis]